MVTAAVALDHEPPADAPSDAALVVAAQAGAIWAMEALFKRHTQRVNSLALALMGRDSEVDDLVQDSFTRALQSLSQLQVPAAFASWLSSIVIGTAHKTFRRRQLLVRLGLSRREPVDMERLIARTAAPDVAAELRAVYSVIGELPPEARLALILRRVEGMKFEEIADAMQVSLSTVKRRLSEAERVLDFKRGS